MLIIGEGLSLNSYRGIDEMIFRALNAGTAVICLAPAEGLITMPATAAIPVHLRQFSLKSSAVVKELDKRLTFDGWPADNAFQNSGIVFQPDRGAVSAGIIQGHRSWPWMEIHTGEEGRKLVVCCFRIIEQWNIHPAPRYLLLRMFEYVWGGYKETKN
jgi:hypothetical protein